MEEKDRVEVIDLDAATFKYERGLCDTFMGLADPFRNELEAVSFEHNPAEPSQPTSEIKFVAKDDEAALRQGTV